MGDETTSSEVTLSVKGKDTWFAAISAPRLQQSCFQPPRSQPSNLQHCTVVPASPIVAALKRTPAQMTVSPPTESSENLIDTDGAQPASASKVRRAAQVVPTRSDRVRIVAWVVEQEVIGETKLMSKAVAAFPDVFWAITRPTLKRPVTSGRKDIPTYSSNSITRRQSGTVKRVQLKASESCGRTRAPWVLGLHGELIEELLRLCSMNIKVSISPLVEVGKYLLTADGEGFGADTLEASQSLIEHINAHWTQTFCEQ